METGETALSTHCPHSGFDLIVADLKSGLVIPGISLESSDVPSWNEYSLPQLESVFEFSEKFLHAIGGLLLFLPDQGNARTDVLSYAQGYDFQLFREWWGINDLPCSCPMNPKLKVPHNPSLLISFKCKNLFLIIGN